MKGAYLAWSEGPQICPGLKFSQVEFVVVLACLMRSYRIQVVKLKGETEAQAMNRVLQVVNDCDMQLLLRMKNADNIKLRCVKIG
jgi:cytochrome P450